MNFTKPGIIIKLGDGADEAVLKFTQLKNNVRQRIAYDLKMVQDVTDDFERLKHYQSYQDAVMQSCVEVENLSEDGKAITASDVKAGAVYPETATAILVAYFAAVAQAEKKPEAEEKKEASPAA